MPVSQSTEEIFVTTTLKAWDAWVGRTSQIFDSFRDEEMLKEIAPGKNRVIYVFGHLIAVNDALIPTLGLGEAGYPHLKELFIDKPDRAVALPPVSELRQNWKDLNARLDRLFTQLTPAQWLERHAMVSEEDFAKEPHRNRIAVLQSRTSHVAYHLGQLKLLSR